jgi:hypothetical protein
MLVASCSTMRKSVKQQKQETKTNSFLSKDSVGSASFDTSSVSRTTGWIEYSSDSGYDKVTEEVIKEVIDSNIIRRETTRTIKEKGQKRVEQSTQVSRYDSSSKKVAQNSSVKQLQKMDSTGVTVSIQKDVKRTTFLPWWIWLIVAGVGVLGWWKRNNIIDYFT